MATEQKIVRDFLESIKASSTGTEAYDTTAEVIRIENNTAWVHIPGGVDETPVSMTVNAIPGDTVRVRVAGGAAWLTGSDSAPPTDDRMANIANNNAGAALTQASAAQLAAAVAQESAESALASAATASAAAEQAVGDAATAKAAADSAQDSADNALSYAGTAITQLSIVEDVVGAINWISSHGEYQLTADASVVAGKYYFTRSGAGTDADPYVYSVVTEPADDPSAAGYYEIASIDEAVSNYVLSHLALTDDGLWLQTDGEGSRILISPSEGVKIYGQNGQVVATYGSTAVIGDSSGFHIEITGTELGFYEGQTKVAYVSNNTLHIAQSVVLTEMRVGEKKWTWKLDPTDDSIYLKWIG